MSAPLLTCLKLLYRAKADAASLSARLPFIVRTIALTDLIQVLYYQKETSLSDYTADKILLLMECLRKRRCLLVLDAWEAILQGGKLAGHYLEGYEHYEQLLKVIGQSSHGSCLILTSREKPREIPNRKVQRCQFFHYS